MDHALGVADLIREEVGTESSDDRRALRDANQLRGARSPQVVRASEDADFRAGSHEESRIVVATQALLCWLEPLWMLRRSVA